MKRLFFLILLMPTFTLASPMPPNVSGVVKSINSKTVILEQSGKRLTIPRKYFGKTPLKTGQIATAKNVSRDVLQQMAK